MGSDDLRDTLFMSLIPTDCIFAIQQQAQVGYACPLYVRRGVVTEGSEAGSFAACGVVCTGLRFSSSPMGGKNPAPGALPNTKLGILVGRKDKRNQTKTNMVFNSWWDSQLSTI